MADMHLGHLGRHRHQVVGHGGGQQVALLVIDAVLVQRAAQALHDAAAHLFVDQQRVDHAAAILDAPVFEQLHHAGLGIDFDPAGLDAVCEGEGVVLGDEVARLHQFARQILGQRVASEIDDAAELAERHAFAPGVAVHHLAHADIERLGRCLEHRAGHHQDLLLQRDGGLQRRLAADTRAAAGPGAAAIGRGLGVAGDDLHAFERHADAVGHDLAQDAFRPLPLLRHAGQHDDGAVGIHAHRRAILRRDARAADAVHEGRGIGQFDEAREAEAAMYAALALLRLVGADAIDRHHFQQLVECGVMRQPFEAHARRRSIGIGVVADQVAPADLDRVDAQRLGRHVHEAFRHRGRDRVADGAVLAGRRLVLQHHRRGAAVVGEIVRPAAQVHDLVALDRAGAGIDRVRADARAIIDVECKDLSIGIHRDAPRDTMVARMDVGDEALEAIGDELHRTAEDLRHRGHRDLVRIDMHLDAEGSADILADDAHRAFLDAQLLREDALHHVRRLRRVMDGQRPLGAVPVRDDTAWFECHAGVPAGDEGGLDHLVRGGHRGGDVALFGGAREDQVIAKLRMDDHSAGIECGLHVELRGQRFPLDRERGHAILRGRAAVRHHGHHRLALPGRAIERQRMLHRRLHPLEVIERRHPGVADLRQVGAGEHPHHPRHAQRRRGVDRHDPRMRMRAAQEGGVHHARKRHVVGIGRAALHQLRHIGPRHRAPDVGIRQVLARQANGGRGDLVHRTPPFRTASVLSTASTIAW